MNLGRRGFLFGTAATLLAPALPALPVAPAAAAYLADNTNRVLFTKQWDDALYHEYVGAYRLDVPSGSPLFDAKPLTFKIVARNARA
jgi:hypothetical protein